MEKLQNFSIVCSRILEARELDPMCPKFAPQTLVVRNLDLGPYDDVYDVIETIFGNHGLKEEELKGDGVFVFVDDFWGPLKVNVVKRSKFTKKACDLFTGLYEGFRKICCHSRKARISPAKFFVPLIPFDPSEPEIFIKKIVYAEPSYTAISHNTPLDFIKEDVDEMIEVAVIKAMFEDEGGYETYSESEPSSVSSSEFMDTHYFDEDECSQAIPSFFSEDEGDVSESSIETQSGLDDTHSSGSIPTSPIQAAHEIRRSKVQFADLVAIEAISDADLEFIRGTVDEMVDISMVKAQFFAREWK
jgi:hypothetical protein